MNVGSLFSGVGGFDLGLERAGMTILWQVEYDKQCRQVLKHRFEAELYTDVRDVGSDLEPVSIICGGFPCQDLSVAGKRAGLAGEKSGLWHEFHRIIGELAPRWVLIENVPGLLSSNDGRDLAVVLHGLEELGYGWAYRILDSQYFGVPQRRRRVFIVGCAGDQRAAFDALFPVGTSLPGDPAPSREAGSRIAASLTRGADSAGKGGYAGRRREDDFNLVAGFTPSSFGNYREGFGTLRAEGGDVGPGSENLIAQASDYAKGDYELTDVARPLTTSADRTRAAPIVAPCLRGQAYNNSDPTMESQMIVGPHNAVATKQWPAEIAPTMNAHYGDKWGLEDQHALNGAGMFVGLNAPRRLTPKECERLQGFPDDWTFVDGMKDGPRYRMMGNAVTVNVAYWIGQQIMAVEADNLERAVA